MLIGLTIRDVVLIKALDLEVPAGLTVLTGETGAGKSILLDALGLALGRRADPALVRAGAEKALAAADFLVPPEHPAHRVLEERGLEAEAGEPLSLRRQISADGRSRAFVNDQPTSAGVLRELGALLVEVHGQHETVGLLDSKTHRSLLDGAPEVRGPAEAAGSAWRRHARARAALQALREAHELRRREADERGARLEELERLDPRPGEEAELQQERALLSSAEKALADIEAARQALSADQLRSRLAGAFRSLERARDRALQAGADPEGEIPAVLTRAAEAVDRALNEALEAEAAVEAAETAFQFDPERLERTEERLFALRAAARKLGVTVDGLAEAREGLRAEAEGLEAAGLELARADQEAKAAEAAFLAEAAVLTAAREKAAARLGDAVMAELGPLKLEKARFRVVLDPLPPERAGPSGLESVEFQVSTNPGAPFGPLGAIASGGELARIALALKAALADRGEALGPVMIFDEVDQGVGGAVADAVGVRLKRLSASAQVILVTHSPQIAARADAHWRISKTLSKSAAATEIQTLAPALREEEIARMLSGAEVTEAARAAARALLEA